MGVKIMDLTYGEYLRLNKILSAQEVDENSEHDEMLFIVIHQTYELWFKQLLHETYFLQKQLSTFKGHQALSTVSRILTILKTAVSQVDILETMTPISFASFRSRLKTSSGFQSVQFRQLEFLLGQKNEHMLEYHKNSPSDYETLKKQLQLPTLYDSLFQYLNQCENIQLSEQILKRDYTKKHESNEEIYKALKDIYNTDSFHRLVLEKFVDLDEGMQEWRYRHVKMVERTIGNKPGSGGSKGVEFLKSTLFKPLFPELWEVRSEF